MFTPKLITTLKGYTQAQALADVTAGVIVGIVALPLAIAFAIASGVTPDRGLWTAIIAGFLISTLGGSRVQIGGPTGAFVVIVYGIVQKFGVDGLIVATIMAGIILIALGLARLGSAIKFIPLPVITGFTSGIAVIIFSSQIKDFLGLQMGAVAPEFLAKWTAYAAHVATANTNAIVVAVVALSIIILWPRVSRRIPGPFVALVATTALVQLLHLNVATIGSRFGAISASFPAFTVPVVAWPQVQALIVPAFTIAILGAVESLLSAVVADGMIGARHRSNVELVAQGVANVVAPFFGGIPATGAIARTATNVKNGGRTPVAGIVHALTLLLITLFAGHWAALIPMSTLAAILVVVAYHMCEWRTFLLELRSPKSDVAVLLVTFGLTVFVDLTVAIATGLMLAALLFVRRMSNASTVQAFALETEEGRVQRKDIPEGVEVYEITGALFFGAVEKFRDTIALVAGTPRVLVIRMRNVPTIDATGMHALRDVIKRGRARGTQVLLTELQGQPLLALSKSVALGDGVGTIVFATIGEALDYARGQPNIAA
ncbi:MAG: SulP family inorganic anion transporter [Gemmatimonadota bacterium]|nr:SulP family inorganic anion transporter [Gemmatimonadota bacterium]